MSSSLSSAIANLSSVNPAERNAAASEIHRTGRNLAEPLLSQWCSDNELSGLLGSVPLITVGVAVNTQTFTSIREANGQPRLAVAPPDQDAQEFELHFPENVLLDILTTRAPAESGAIARYLAKFGEGIQQVEFRCSNVDRATEILLQNFGVAPIYPQTRPGADGTRVNFFLVPIPNEGKVLIELYEI